MSQPESLLWIGVLGALPALICALLRCYTLKKLSPGSEALRKAAGRLAQGTRSYAKWHGAALLLLLGAGFGGLLILKSLGQLTDPLFPFAFLSGALCVFLLGLLGILLTPWLSARTAAALEDSPRKGLSPLLSGGAILGFATFGLALLELTVWLCVLHFALGCEGADLARSLPPFGLGSAAAALLTRLAAGLFSPAATLGSLPADTAEEPIPADDPRSPGALTRALSLSLEGHPLLGTGLYSSYLSILALSLFLGYAVHSEDGLGSRAMLLPLLCAAIGLLCSLMASYRIRTGDGSAGKNLLRSLWLSIGLAILLTAAVTAPLVYLLMGSFLPWLELLLGLAAGCALVRGGQSLAARPAKGERGSLPDALSGGLLAALLPLLLLLLVLFAAYRLSGFYGLSLALVGMLAPGASFLSAASCGGIAHTARALLRLSAQEEDLSPRAKPLTATADLLAFGGRSYDLCAALSSALLLLLSLFPVRALFGPFLPLPDLFQPATLAGLLLGALMAPALAGLLLRGCRSAAKTLAQEQERQLREIRGLRSGKVDPDFCSCVRLCACHSLTAAAPPLLLALTVPTLTWLLLGSNALAALLAGLFLSCLALGFPLVFLGELWSPASPEGLPCRAVAGPALISLLRFWAVALLALSLL